MMVKNGFIGSANETSSAWKQLWCFGRMILRAISWVQEEFDYFWNSPYAIPLSEFVMKILILRREDLLSRRVERRNKPSSTVIESRYIDKYGL